MDFILSDSSQTNSNGFRTEVAGGDFTRFTANPVMLYAHDNKAVIGRWTNLRVEGGKLIATPDFDLADPAAKEIARKVEAGYLKGASVGMSIRKMELRPISETDEEWVVTAWELIEASVCPIPSDAGAIRLYNEKYEEVQFEQVKLNFNTSSNSNNQNNEKKMSKAILLTMACMASLGITTEEYSTRDVELAVAEKDQKIKDLEAQLALQKQEAVETFLSQAEAGGKITAVEKVQFLNLAKLDFASVQNIVNARTVTASGSLKDLAQVASLSNLDPTRASWTYLEWMQKDSAGLAKMKAENPKEFERLQDNFKL